MQLPLPVRTVTLTAHVLASVGWFGALAVFLAHALASIMSDDLHIVRSVCVAMAVTAWFVILPLCLASVATGVVQALGTSWGLVRHYWIVAKLLLTSLATAVLLLKLAPISELARIATEPSFSQATSRDLKMSLLVHAIGGLVVLLVVTILAIHKPVGVTPFARRSGEHATGTTATVGTGMPRWFRRSLFVAAAVAVLIALLLLHGGHGPAMHSMGGHPG
jgi:hypothetical protein